MPAKSFLYRLSIWLFCFFPALVSAQWTKTNGLPGGYVFSFLQFGDTVVANAGRFHYSTDDGQSWTPLSSSGGYFTYKLAKEGANLYAYSEQDSVGKIVSWSTDFGQTWSWVPLPPNLYFDDFFATQGFLYGNDYQHIYRSADHGVHWDTLPTPLVYHLRAAGQRMVGIRPVGIVESLDGGFTWDTLLQTSGSFVNLIQHENYLFAFKFTASGGCWASSDYGQTWQHFTGTGFDQFYDFVWHDGTLFGLKGNDVYKSTDLGATWSFFEYPNGIPAFAGISSSGSVLIGGSRGVLRSADAGASWQLANQGLFSTAPAQLSITSQGLFAPAEGGIFQLQADSINWNNTNYVLGAPADYASYNAYLQSGNNLILCTGEKVWFSTDEGITWIKSDLPASWNDGGAVSLQLVAGGQIVAILDNGDYISSYISDDQGLTFHPWGSLSIQFQTYIRHFDSQDGQLYILAADGHIYQTGNGEDWSVVSATVPVNLLDEWGGYKARVFVRGNSIWVFEGSYTNTKLAFSADLGQNWTIYNLQTAGFSWGTAAFRSLLQVGNFLIAGTNRGVFYSKDDGLSWTAWSEGLEMKQANLLRFYNGYVWAGMDSDGIWKRPLSDLGVNATENIIRSTSVLPLAVFPNPVADLARLDLPAAGLLTVTDLTGQVLWRKNVPAGLTELQVRNWPAGMYYLHFKTGKNEQAGAMVIKH